MRVFHAAIIVSCAGLMLAGLLVLPPPSRAADLSGTNPDGSILHLAGANTITTSYANDGRLWLDDGTVTLTNTGCFSNNYGFYNSGTLNNNGTLNNTGSMVGTGGTNKQRHTE